MGNALGVKDHLWPVISKSDLEGNLEITFFHLLALILRLRAGPQEEKQFNQSLKTN